MKQTKTVSFSTTMTESTKKLLERYCKSRGIKINHLVEQAILEYLEDEMDKELVHSREQEELVDWKKLRKFVV